MHRTASSEPPLGEAGSDEELASFFPSLADSRWRCGQGATHLALRRIRFSR